jgi:hypothetical protein
MSFDCLPPQLYLNAMVRLRGVRVRALVACMQALTTARAHFPTGTAARRVRAPPGRQLQSPRLRGAISLDYDESGASATWATVTISQAPRCDLP